MWYTNSHSPPLSISMCVCVCVSSPALWTYLAVGTLSFFLSLSASFPFLYNATPYNLQTPFTFWYCVSSCMSSLPSLIMLIITECSFIPSPWKSLVSHVNPCLGPPAIMRVLLSTYIPHTHPCPLPPLCRNTCHITSPFPPLTLIKLHLHILLDTPTILFPPFTHTNTHTHYCPSFTGSTYDCVLLNLYILTLPLSPAPPVCCSNHILSPVLFLCVPLSCIHDSLSLSFLLSPQDPDDTRSSSPNKHQTHTLPTWHSCFLPHLVLPLLSPFSLFFLPQSTSLSYLTSPYLRLSISYLPHPTLFTQPSNLSTLPLLSYTPSLLPITYSSFLPLYHFSIPFPIPLSPTPATSTTLISLHFKLLTLAKIEVTPITATPPSVSFSFVFLITTL